MSVAERIPEDSSNNRRRGRPPLVPDEYLSFLAPGQTRRTANNLTYAGMAMHTLGWEGGDKPPAKYSRFGMSVLAELGRFGSDELTVEAADWLASQEPQPKAREAVAVLRAIRNRSKLPEGSVFRLQQGILALCDEYAGTHRGFTRGKVQAALSYALEEWKAP